MPSSGQNVSSRSLPQRRPCFYYYSVIYELVTFGKIADESVTKMVKNRNLKVYSYCISRHILLHTLKNIYLQARSYLFILIKFTFSQIFL